MTTDLNFTSSETEMLRGGTDYDVKQSALTNVTLTFTLPSTIDSDTVNSNAGQTLNFKVMNLTNLSADSMAGGGTSVILNGNVLNNNGTITAFNSANVQINTRALLGTGMSFIGGSTMTVKGMVGGGQTFQVGYNGESAFFLIDEPRTFFGKVNLSSGPFTPSRIPEGTVDLVGLVATSYGYHNDLLTLYNGNVAVDQLHLNSANFTVSEWQGNGIFPSGVIVSTEPPFGKLLPVHTT